MRSTTYTPEFQADAVKLVLAQGLWLEEAAKRIAIPKATLANRVSTASAAPILQHRREAAACRSWKPR